MRKRKTRAPPLDPPSSQDSSASITSGLQVPASKTTKPSIVWDEERCRIVYEPVPVLNKNKNDSTITTQEDEDEDDDDVSAGDATSCFWETSYDMEQEEERAAVPRVSMEKPDDLSFPMQEELNAVVAASTINATGKGRRGGKRSYASRKRVLLQSPPLNDAVLDVQAHRNNRRTSKRTKKLNNDDDDESKMVDPSQESVSHEEEEDPLEGAIVADEASEEDTKAPCAPPSQPEPSSLFDFDDTEEIAEKTKATSKRPKRASRNQQQPSSKTSVEKARCYFEQLDAKEQLTLDSSQTPPSVAAGNKKACIRTRRRLADTQVADPIVLNEYKDYVTACQESGVTPRPVQSTFFRTTAVYDGFLDE
jgi:hypothetical protein